MLKRGSTYTVLSCCSNVLNHLPVERRTRVDREIQCQIETPDGGLSAVLVGSADTSHFASDDGLKLSLRNADIIELVAIYAAVN